MNFFKSYKTYTDEKLMELVQQNNANAFDELYSRYSHRLLCFMFKMLGNNEDRAQDLLQDLFLKIVERPQLFDTNKKFSTWIFTVAVNMCRTDYRDSKRQTIPTEKIGDITNGSDINLIENIDASFFTAELDISLNALSAEEKETFILRFQQGFSIREISELLDCPEGTIKSRIYYTTRKLAADLQAFKPLLKQ